MNKYLNFILVCSCFFINFSFAPKTVAEGNNYYNYNIPLQNLIHKPIQKNSFSVIVQKSSYTLFLKYKGRLIKSYPCVFGPNPIKDKTRQGDNCTPEGNFYLVDIREHFIWGYFLEINYPNQDSWQNHYEAKYMNEIPDTASIGGDIGLHGVVDGLESFISNKKNWTEGCVALKNKDIIELAENLAIGTPIKIVY